MFGHSAITPFLGGPGVTVRFVAMFGAHFVTLIKLYLMSSVGFRMPLGWVGFSQVIASQVGACVSVWAAQWVYKWHCSPGPEHRHLSQQTHHPGAQRWMKVQPLSGTQPRALGSTKHELLTPKVQSARIAPADVRSLCHATCDCDTLQKWTLSHQLQRHKFYKYCFK